MVTFVRQFFVLQKALNSEVASATNVRERIGNPKNKGFLEKERSQSQRKRNRKICSKPLPIRFISCST